MKLYPRPHFLFLLLFLPTHLFLWGCATPSVGGPTLVVAPAPAAAAPTAAAPTTIETAPLDAELPFDPRVLKGRLANGLSYFIRENGRPENRAELRLFVNAGSLQEDDDQQGLAHFVEHMAFNGTRQFEKQELVSYLESIGMRFGADLNASTSFDETVYQLTVPTDDPEILATAFQILEDWAHGITFDDEEIEKERGVLIEEWRLGRGAAARVRDQQFPILFQGSRYAERLPIGKTEILESAPPEALRRFYRDWYRPELMAVAAVGDFDAAAIEALIRRHFKPLENPAEPRPRRTWLVPGHTETLWSFATDPEVPNTTVAVYTKLPRQPQGTYGAYRRSLVESLYGVMLNARLGELAQRSDPPFVFGYASPSNLVRSSDVYLQGASVREGEVGRGLEAVLTEAARVDQHGFTATELERAKKNLRRRYEQLQREADKIPSGSFAAEYGRHYLEGESVPGIAQEVRLAERFLPTIDLAEVNRLASELVTDENRVILVSGPEKEGAELPSEAELRAVFAKVESSEIEPWVDETRAGPLVSEAPSPGAVVETTEVGEIGVTEWRLANGVRVILKPTDFRNDQILLAGFSPGGHSLVADEDFTSASFATSIVGESGYGQFSSIELGKALAGKVAGGSPYIAELEEGFRGSASPEDLETLFQVLYLAFTEPRFDPEVYQSLQSRWSTLIENRLSRPETVFADALTEALYQDHPRRQPLTEESLRAIDPERALEIYADRFADASDFTFLLVGNFMPSEIRPLIETWLGGLPSTKRRESWRDIGLETPRGVVEVEVEKGLEPKSQVRLIFGGEASWSREAQHDMRSLAQVLEMRLRDVLREDLGATYGVGVGGSILRRPQEEFGFRISFGCEPGEVDRLLAAIWREIELLRAPEIDAEHRDRLEDLLENVKEAVRRQRQVSLRENTYWLQALETSYTFGDDPRGILEVEEFAEAVTLDRVRAAARRWLDPENHVVGVLNPDSPP